MKSIVCLKADFCLFFFWIWKECWVWMICFSSNISCSPVSNHSRKKKIPRSPTFIAVYYTRGFIQKTGKLKLIWSRKWIDCWKVDSNFLPAWKRLELSEKPQKVRVIRGSLFYGKCVDSFADLWEFRGFRERGEGASLYMYTTTSGVYIHLLLFFSFSFFFP